jgi:hypothetical protein
VRILKSVVALAVALAAAGFGVLTAGAQTATDGVVDAAGNLRVPFDYRNEYQYLGTWAVAADQGAGSKELHVVYASPGAVAAFKANGHFPDGTVLVKEVIQATTAAMTTGTVSRAGTLKGWFVVARDATGRYAGNKLWGDGWGWSWFDADQPIKTTSTNYQVDCLSCHVPAKATDWMYTSGYLILHQ